MNNYTIKQLRDLFKEDLERFLAIRKNLYFKSIYSKEEGELNIFEAIAVSFIKDESNKLMSSLAELKFRGYQILENEDFDEEYVFQIYKIDESSNKRLLSEEKARRPAQYSVFQTMQSKLEMNSTSSHSDVFIDITGFDYAIYHYREILELTGNEFFSKNLKSILFSNKLDSELSEKNIVQKILKL